MRFPRPLLVLTLLAPGLTLLGCGGDDDSGGDGSGGGAATTSAPEAG